MVAWVGGGGGGALHKNGPRTMYLLFFGAVSAKFRIIRLCATKIFCNFLCIELRTCNKDLVSRTYAQSWMGSMRCDCHGNKG